MVTTMATSLRHFSRLALPRIPERLKGGRMEKIGLYFKNILDDYKTVAVEVVQDMKDRPVKSAIYLSLLGTSWYFFKHNPSEEMFMEQLIDNTNELLLVGDGIRNPHTDNHMQTVTRWHIEGRLRRFTFVVFSIMWVDDYDRSVDVYEARAPPLKVGWLEMKERVVDIGVLGHWLRLEQAMKDYDINPLEWTSDTETREKPLPQLPDV